MSVNAAMLRTESKREGLRIRSPSRSRAGNIHAGDGKGGGLAPSSSTSSVVNRRTRRQIPYNPVDNYRNKPLTLPHDIGSAALGPPVTVKQPLVTVPVSNVPKLDVLPN